MRAMRIAAAVLLCVAGGVVVAPAPALAADTAPAVVEEISLSRTTVSVAGLDLVPVTVSVHLTDESGVEETSDFDGTDLPYVLFERREGDRAPTEYVELSLVSGTATDGVWRGTVEVPSTWNGHWEVSRVGADDAAGNRLEADPRPDITTALDVRGSHIPAVTLAFRPSLLVGSGPLTVHGRFYYTDTGKGIGNQLFFIGADNVCAEGSSPAPNARTAADGTYSFTYQEIGDVVHCVGIPIAATESRPRAFLVATGAFTRIRPVVAASANDTSVAPGTKVTISATVTPSTGNVTLQQLRNGHWRHVSGLKLGEVGASAKYTVTVTPKTAGTYKYRVVADGGESDLVGISNVVEVVAGEGGGGGGDLPTTGPAALSLAGGALALLLVGAGLVLVTRRKRTRVEP